MTTVRLFSVYGRGDRPQRLLPRLMAAARTGEAMPLSAPGVVRDWVHVDDVVDALLLAAITPSTAGQVLHCGTGVATSISGP